MKNKFLILFIITILFTILTRQTSFAATDTNTWKVGYTTTSVNVRKGPSTDSDILETYKFNRAVVYKNFTEKWVRIRYAGKIAYMAKDYISNVRQEYKPFDVPANSGFKSYMPYTSIKSKSSPQYKLQKDYAYTGNYGIRQVNGRYCIALGTHFGAKIGTYIDLELANGTTIPCVLADIKDDAHTDSSNIVTMHNGCVSEFVVDKKALVSSAKRMGNISYCREEWKSPVVKVKVYERNVL